MNRIGWIASVSLAVLAFVLVVVNIVFGQVNLSSRNTLAGREQYNAQTAQLARVDQLVVGAIADAAQRDSDSRLRDLLSSNGVTVRPAAAPSGPPIIAPSAPKP